MKQILTITLFSCLIVLKVAGQKASKEQFIQVDGIVYDEQHNPLPNISLYSIKLRKGASSKSSGIYSIISVPGDTIVFSSIGLRNTLLLTPPDYTGMRYFADVIMEFDTISINDVLVLPWATYAEFKRAVVDADMNNYEVDNMNKNLILIQSQIINDIGISPEVAYRQAVQQFSDAAYTRNQFPANNLLNPFAWAKFFQELKSGLLKNEKRK